MKIFLIGYMASGKTTFGKKLSKTLDLQFIDLDDRIEEKSGRTIKHIFETDGEDIFRKLESDTLKSTIQNENNFVLATGGGTPCFYDNIKLMLKNGVTVYLELDIKTLVNRLVSSKIYRPLIWGKTESELKEYAEKMLTKRNPYYNQAHIIIDELNPDVEKAAKKISKKYKKSKKRLLIKNFSF